MGKFFESDTSKYNLLVFYNIAVERPNLAIFTQRPGKVKQDTIFSNEGKLKKEASPHLLIFQLSIGDSQFIQSM